MKNIIFDEKFEENTSKNNFSSQYGITIISLVITIIVLIILASIVINLSIGETGLFNRAKQAKMEYINSQKTEENGINNLSSQITNILDSDMNLNNVVDSSSKSNTEKIGSITLSNTSTFSITYTGDNKKSLTANNFIVEFISFYNGPNASNNSYNWNLSKTYNPSTGILSITRGPIPGSSASIAVNIWVHY